MGLTSAGRCSGAGMGRENMANHKSAEKRARQNVKRRANNRAHRSRLRNQIKRLRQAVEKGEMDTAKELLRPTLSLVDRSGGRV